MDDIDKKKRILVVDDETILVEEIKIRLEHNNYEVLTAYDGQEALDKAREQLPDLIILDLMLPRIDGYKVCGLLKSDWRYNKIPIIILTAVYPSDNNHMDLDVGADAYIMKPFEASALLSKIREFLKV